MYTLMDTAKHNDVTRGLALARTAETPQTRLHELLSWH